MTFGSWLQDEIHHRGWSLSDLARAIHASPSTVSRWVNDIRLPDAASCRQIALGMGIPEDVVLLQAGHADFRDQRITELDGKIAALNAELARTYARAEQIEEEIDQLHHQRAILDEQASHTSTTIHRVLHSLREVPMTNSVRNEIEKRVIAALSQL